MKPRFIKQNIGNLYFIVDEKTMHKHGKYRTGKSYSVGKSNIDDLVDLLNSQEDKIHELQKEADMFHSYLEEDNDYLPSKEIITNYEETIHDLKQKLEKVKQASNIFEFDFKEYCDSLYEVFK